MGHSSLFELLNADELVRVVGVHCALSAKLAHAQGARALWLSGFGVSAMKGLRDANEVTWSDVVDVAGDVCAAQPCPVILDGDNGHGDYNNSRLLATRARRMGVQGISIEDKPYPKVNSFTQIPQVLLDTRSFTDKIRAVKDALGNDMYVLARTEAFICKQGVEEAVERADAYLAAGADAIIVHSKAPDTRELHSFRSIWGGSAPLVVIPTAFLSTADDEYRRLGVRAVILANMGLRAAAQAMALTYRHLVDGTLPALADTGPAMMPFRELLEMSEQQVKHRIW